MTISVDIKEQDLMNLVSLNNLNLGSFDEKGHKSLFETFPITLYKNRMVGNNVVTIQIPIINYILFSAHGLVK